MLLPPVVEREGQSYSELRKIKEKKKCRSDQVFKWVYFPVSNFNANAKKC